MDGRGGPERAPKRRRIMDGGMSVSGIDAVGFDAYGTLFDVTGARWAAPEVVATARQKQLQYSWLVTLMGDYHDFRELTRRAIEYALAEHGVEGLEVDQALAAQTRLPPYPEVPEALERLARGRRLAVVSNGHPESLEALLAGAGLGTWIPLVVSAHEVRAFKPAPAVYRLALDRLGVGRERLLFVSSNGWDVAGAARFGLRTAWINRPGLPPEGVGPPPELVVPDLLALAAELEAR